ncbi:hypothetical protein D3C72_2139530 [compost metagenome]
MGVAHPQRLFERKQVEGIDDGRNALAHDGIRHGMNADLRRVRNLLDTDDDMHAVHLHHGRFKGCTGPSA